MDVLSWLANHGPSILSALGAVGAVALGFLNRSKIQEIHLTMNSRMDQLLAVSTQAAMAEGHAAGMAEQKVETPAIWDSIDGLCYYVDRVFQTQKGR